MGLDERVTPIRQHPKSDETTSKAHLKPGWMGILPAVTMAGEGDVLQPNFQTIRCYPPTEFSRRPSCL